MSTETHVATQSAGPVAAPSAKKTFEQLVASDQFKSQIAAALPKHLTPERFIRVLMTATMKNPQLLECTQESMFKGIFDCAAAGLELDGRRAHLVPLRNTKKQGAPLEANLWLDYKGIAELVMRSGVVSNIHADVICENDIFEYDRGELKRHTIDFKKPRGEMYAAYCIIRMKDGGEKVEVMGKEDIDRIRNGSMGKNATPWTQHYNEQAKKTVFKRASKWVPLSPETRDVVEDKDEVIDISSSPSNAPALTDGAPPVVERAPPRPRAARGAATVMNNPVPPVAQPANPPPAPEPPQSSAPVTTTAAQSHVQSSIQPVVDGELEGDPKAETPVPAPLQRAMLAPGEKMTAIVKVKSLITGYSPPDKVSVVVADVDGQFHGKVHHYGGAALPVGDLATAPDPIPDPKWTVGNTLRLALIGFKLPSGKVQHRVETAQTVIENE